MPILIKTSGGAVTGSESYSNFQMISVVNHSGAGGNVVVTLSDGSTVRIFPGEAWGLPNIGQSYAGITVDGSAGDCDVTVV